MTATVVDRFLAEQAMLTPVERFSDAHDAGAVHDTWHDRIPLSAPADGQQYAFEVDLDACTGCKACVTACRSLNGLDPDESWRSVGLLHGPSVRQHVTTACHHCLDPACLNGCPVQAYEKDASTGIVRHLDDQCIGCGYCTLTCPYEVPRYNPRLGIVRKCDMCADRLEAGEAPACVQACPNGAIAITVVDISEKVAGPLVPGAPSSEITRPVTRYRSRRGLDGLVAADHHALRPSQPHPPLAVMLVLTQLAVGAFVTGSALRWFAPDGVPARLRPSTAAVALAAGLLALGASVFHLGRPRYAYRAVLGVRRSWLSREIVAFGAFSALAAAYAAVQFVAPAMRIERPLAAAVAAAGLAGVGCSVMVYAATRRRFWSGPSTAVRFGGTTLLCGTAAVLCTAQAVGVRDAVRPLIWVLACTLVAKLAWEASVLRHLLDRTDTDLRRTARLLTGDLWGPTRARFGVALAGGLLALGVLRASGGWSLALSVLALAAIVAGELVERSLFFRAVVAPRMPGDRT